ncbi:hypothetical protein [Sulfitobacter sp. R86518]|uniref:hypothetical protein n=1 Tax=Sulfitobacter sp. R86518 TaxID=3093858 RepID=UPI0036DD05C6
MSEEKKTELVSVQETAPSISIEGWDLEDDQLADLLEETAKFLKENKGTDAVKVGSGQLRFRSVETGQLFDLVHRS